MNPEYEDVDEELSERDLKMLEMLGQHEESDEPDYDKNQEGVDLSGVTGSESENAEAPDDDTFAGDVTVGEAEVQESHAEGTGDSEGEQGESQGKQDDGSGQDGEGNQDTQNTEGGEEANKDGSESDSDAQAELDSELANDGEGEQDGGEGEGEGEEEGEQGEEGEVNEGDENGEEGDGDGEGEEKEKECNGECEQADDDDGEGDECEYCKQKDQTQDSNDGIILANDRDGNPIQQGTEVRLIIHDAVGFVLGLSNTGGDGDNMQYRWLVIRRRDGKCIRAGGFKTADGQKGWGERAIETLVEPTKEDKQEQREEERDKQDKEREERQKDEREQHKRVVVCTDRNGAEVYEGDSIQFIMDSYRAENGTLASAHENTDQGSSTACFASTGISTEGSTKNGIPAWTFILGEKISCVEKVVNEENQEQEKDQLNDKERRRFEQLSERLFSRSKIVFGKTLEQSTKQEIEDCGYFYDEEVSQSLEIQSRGVNYRVTLTAQKRQ